MKLLRSGLYPFALVLLLLFNTTAKANTIHHIIIPIDSALYSKTDAVATGGCPTATISYGGFPFCSTIAVAEPVTQSGTTGGTYTSTTGLAIDAATGGITPSSSTPGNYTVTYTIPAGSGCSAVTATTSVTITAVPTATISYASPFCSNAGTATVTHTGTTGGTYTHAPSGLTMNVANGSITPSTSTAGTYTVTYTMAAAGGCSVQTATTTVTIVTLPSATISYAGPFCSSDASAEPVTQTGRSGGTYSSTAGLTINAATGAITPSTSTAGIYTVTYTIAAGGGCSAQTATTSVTINPLVAPYITCGTPTDTSLAFNWTPVSGATAYTISYQINPPSTPQSGGSITATTYTASGGIVAGENVQITVTPTGTGCFASQSFTCTDFCDVTFLATVSYTGAPFCSSLATAQPVTQSGTVGGTYSSTTGLTINSATGAITPSSSTPGTYTVTYTMFAAPPCPNGTATTSVTILPAPSPSFIDSSAVDTVGQVATYTTQSSNSNYQWNLSGALNTDYTIVSGGTITDTSITVKWLTAGNKTVAVNYTNGTGCTGTQATTTTDVSATTKVQICPPIGSASCISSLTGTVYQWQVDTGSGYNNISDGTNYSGTNSNTLQLINVPSSYYGYHYRCIVDGNNSTIYNLQVLDTWTGAVDNKWENPANWSCASVPDNNTDVIINSGTITLNSNTTVRSLTLNPTASFTVASGFNLTITH